MTLRLVLIGLIGFVVVVGFALDENSYGTRRRRRKAGDAEAESAA